MSTGRKNGLMWRTHTRYRQNLDIHVILQTKFGLIFTGVPRNMSVVRIWLVCPQNWTTQHSSEGFISGKSLGKSFISEIPRRDQVHGDHVVYDRVCLPPPHISTTTPALTPLTSCTSTSSRGHSPLLAVGKLNQSARLWFLFVSQAGFSWLFLRHSWSPSRLKVSEEGGTPCMLQLQLQSPMT